MTERVAHDLLKGATMRSRSLPLLSLLSMLLLTPTVHAKPATPIVAAVTATQIDLEVAELGKDGARRATTLTLLLPDRNAHGGQSETELKTHVQEERGVAEYNAKVLLEYTAASTRYAIELRRSGGDPARTADLRLEVVRTLAVATPVQISRVVRPDGSSTVVTATVR